MGVGTIAQHRLFSSRRDDGGIQNEECTSIPFLVCVCLSVCVRKTKQKDEEVLRGGGEGNLSI